MNDLLRRITRGFVPIFGEGIWFGPNPFYQEEVWKSDKISDLDQILEIELENFSLEEAIPRSVFEAHPVRFRPVFS